MYYRIFSKIYGRAAKKMCLDCQGFIKKGSKILDWGCGTAIVGKTFQDFFQAELFGVDVQDVRTVKIPFKITDGKSLSFPENSFDVVLINYVLHHSEDPVSVLKEAKRVARDKIVIYEDLPEDILSKLICQLHGISFDNFFGNPTKTSFKTELPKEAKRRDKSLTELPKEAKVKKRVKLSSPLHPSLRLGQVKMRTKFSFASEREWEKIFKELRLNIIFKKRVNNFPVKKELFILRV